MNNEGKIDAWDLHPHRVKLVEEAASQLGITIIKAEEKDATEYVPVLKEHYDRVLLDVPCSGLGVIRKKPDIKWQRQPEDMEELVPIQEKILNTCSEYVRPGGTLLYSTCTVLKQENEEQIEKFVAKHSEYSVEEKINLYPNVDGTDGFFICKLHKQ